MSFTPANLEKARDIIVRYPHKKSATLPLLHLAQDQDGWVTPEAMEEIAELLDLTPALVLGTCSFYTMFKREPVGKLVVSVCTNVSCLVNRGPELLEHLERQYADDPDVGVEEVECIAACDLAPVIQVNYEFHGPLTPDSADSIIEEYKSGVRVAAHDLGIAARMTRDWSSTMVTETRIVTKFLRDHPDDSWTLDASLANGTYATLDTLFDKAPEDIVKQVMDSGLRGRGGAGFGTGQKWSFLPKDIFPRYLAVNGDEGEPSTFKDHMLIEGDPHQLIEGIVITSYAIQAHHAFVYLRGEFALGAERLGQALADAYARGFVGKNIKGSGYDLEIILHRGAGTYIAGDETGLLSSLEGERAMPRIKPPFPAVQGVYAAPTIVNNIETLSTVPHIMRNGAEWYAAMGVNRSKGTRLFSVSGQVERPGNYEVELGITFRDLIEGLAGGVRGGKKLGFFIPGGASSPWLLEEHLDAPLDMDYVQSELSATTMLGSGALMVYDEDVDPLLVAWRIAKFFAHESCGKCTPCREGSGWLEKVLYRMVNGYGRPDDLDLMLGFGNNLAPGLGWPPGMTTICQLGPSTMSPVVSLNRFWRDEIIERMTADAARRDALKVTAAV